MQKVSVDRAMRQARTLELKGNRTEARRIYRAILQRAPGHAQAKAALAAMTGEGVPKGAPQSQTIQAFQKTPASAPAPVATSATAQATTGPAKAPRGTVNALVELCNKGQYVEAERQASALVRQYPGSYHLWNILGASRIAQNRHESAEEAFRRAIECDPASAEANNNLGAVLQRSGRQPEAARQFRRAVELKDKYPEAHHNLATSLSGMGEEKEAIVHFRRAIELKPAYGAAHRALADLTTYAPDNKHLAMMQTLYDKKAVPPAEHGNVCYALSKAYEDIGEYQKSLAFLREANGLRRTAMRYTFDQDVAQFRRIRDLEEAAQCDPPIAAGDAAVQPIFILGMPRSGTTLIEHILSSHSQVHGAGELAHVFAWVRQHGFLDMAKPCKVPTRDDFAALRAFYLKQLAAESNGAAVVTDKMPHNFRWIGFIARALPEAKIVHIRRDPAATVWSNYKHYFTTTELGYAYKLEDTVAYYRLYSELMDYWEARFPGRILQVDYEALTRDPEAQIRQLVADVGLDWEDACLESHKNKRIVNTASRMQVRKKIYTGSSQAWKNFEPYLDGVLSGL